MNRMRLRRYADNTEKTYREWIRRFLLYTRIKPPRTATPGHVKRFLTYLAVERKVSASTQNQAFNALLFLYREVLGIEFGDFRNTIRAKQSKHIPVVLSKEEIKNLFRHLSGILLLMLKLIYAGGLRLTECVRLRVEDIDFDNQTLIIRSGKGDKDRTTLFPEFLHPPLKAHYVGQQVLQRAMKAALKKTDIAKAASVHTLRHSFARTCFRPDMISAQFRIF